MVNRIFDTINGYLTQSGTDWVTMSEAVGNNPIIIGFYLFGCISICVSFFIINILVFKSFRRRGFMSVEHRKVARWLVSFLILCGVVFGIHSFAFLYAAYWIYSGLICIAGISAIFTTVLYVKYFNSIKNLPTADEILTLKKENLELKRREIVLRQGMELWSQNLETHIAQLKAEHERLTSELSQNQTTTIHLNEDIRQQIVDSLHTIQKEIKSFELIVTNTD